jgi:iron only hydrogenase large subunit-like protein
MGLIEQVNDMQARGIPEDQIIGMLQEQGISPRDITEAINQAQIKRAISSGTDSQQYPPQEYAPQSGGETMQQEYYSENQGYASGGETETIISIAEQVFMEKIKNIQKITEETSEFKALSELKIKNMEERLTRLETIIDKLQISILEEVGSYGKRLENTKKEMEMMQDSFRKVIGNKKS